MWSYEQRRVKEHLGHIVHRMEIDPRRDVINGIDSLMGSIKKSVLIF